MLFAVATLDSIIVYDTQARHICPFWLLLLQSWPLHHDSDTDWLHCHFVKHSGGNQTGNSIAKLSYIYLVYASDPPYMHR